MKKTIAKILGETNTPAPFCDATAFLPIYLYQFFLFFRTLFFRFFSQELFPGGLVWKRC